MKKTTRLGITLTTPSGVRWSAGCEIKSESLLGVQRRHESNSKSDWRTLREANLSETWPSVARSCSTPRVDCSKRVAKNKRSRRRDDEINKGVCRNSERYVHNGLRQSAGPQQAGAYQVGLRNCNRIFYCCRKKFRK